jgi:hypothetical protein
MTRSDPCRHRQRFGMKCAFVREKCDTNPRPRNNAYGPSYAECGLASSDFGANMRLVSSLWISTVRRRAQLVIEVDGPIHEASVEQDVRRQEFLESLDLRVVRFTNDEILHEITRVERVIEEYASRT